jgi:hypothetical protein
MWWWWLLLVGLFAASCGTAAVVVYLGALDALPVYVLLMGLGVVSVKLLLYPEEGMVRADRHKVECAASGSLVVLVTSAMDGEHVLAGYVSVILVVLFVVSHLVGMENMEPLVYLNVVLMFIRPPSVLNVVAFAVAYSGLVWLQLSTIMPLTLEADPRAGFVHAIRVAYLLHVSVTWVGIGLIHIMIEYYWRYVPVSGVV